MESFELKKVHMKKVGKNYITKKNNAKKFIPSQKSFFLCN